jgi:hypothetical protein
VPVSWEIRDDLLHLVLAGGSSVEEIASAFEEGLAGVRARRIRLLWDASGSTAVPDSRGVQRRIDLLARHRGRCTRIAIVGRSGVMFGLARQIAQTLDCQETAVEAFWDLADAKQWLGRRTSGVTSRV